MDAWWRTQKHFLRVRPIFSSRDVALLLSRESLLFEKIDTAWRKTVARAAVNPSLSSICDSGNLLEPFRTMQADLNILDHSLNTYLDRVRKSFPRFFFPSEPELLDIIASGYNDISGINTHIERLYPGVHRLQYRESDGVFHGCQSKLGEVISIIPSVRTQVTSP